MSFTVSNSLQSDPGKLEDGSPGGNCLADSIVQQLDIEEGLFYTGMHLRRQVAVFMCRQAEAVYPIVSTELRGAYGMLE